MVWCVYFIVFFFKQKTAYEMRISDWSSDVCSSDLAVMRRFFPRETPRPARYCSSCAKEAETSGFSSARSIRTGHIDGAGRGTIRARTMVPSQALLSGEIGRAHV